MINRRRQKIPLYPKKSPGLKILSVVGLIAGCSATALATETISGVARNQTQGRIAAGDEVILLRLDQGMQEEARTRTDSKGMFLFPLQYPGKPHLVRVMHQGVNYDRQASAGEAISIDVFDAQTRVKGITGSLEVIRTGATRDQLHVSDMIELRNDAEPPVTQAGERTFEIYLPPHAKMDSVLAAGSEKIGVMISATPAPGDPNHYTVNFPLRPGATKFAFNYDLPYDGQARFQIKNRYSLQQLAVMIPSTMKFTSTSSTFQSLPVGGNSYHVESLQNVKEGTGSEFEISGFGAFPSLSTQSSSKSQTAAPAAHDSSVLGRLRMQDERENALEGTSDTGWSSLLLDLPGWLFFTIALVLEISGVMIWRKRWLFANALAHTVAEQGKVEFQLPPIDLLENLKKELFQLEIDRLLGDVSPEAYTAAKRALEQAIEQLLAQSRESKAS